MLRGVSKGWPPFGSGRFARRAARRPIARAGLMARLDAADGIVVLVGGAGAGKSTLLDAWVAARGGMLVDLAQQRLGDAPPDGTLAIDGAAAGDVAQIRRL